MGALLPVSDGIRREVTGNEGGERRDGMKQKFTATFHLHGQCLRPLQATGTPQNGCLKMSKNKALHMLLLKMLHVSMLIQSQSERSRCITKATILHCKHTHIHTQSSNPAFPCKQFTVPSLCLMQTQAKASVLCSANPTV